MNAQTHVIIWADSSNPIYRGELETPKRDKKEAPAMGRGLESREETPKEGETMDRTFLPQAKLCLRGIGLYLGMMASSSVGRAGGCWLLTTLSEVRVLPRQPSPFPRFLALAAFSRS